MINRLTEESVKELLQKQDAGCLGCVLETGEPYVVPVNYIFGEDCIYIHSLRGKKIRAMRANPNICLQTDVTREEGLEWQSAIAFGEFEEITDKSQKIELLDAFCKRFPRFTPVEAVANETTIEQIVVFCLRIKRLTGVSETISIAGSNRLDENN